MATNLLNNCGFDLTKIKKLYIGTSLSTGGTINFPLDYYTAQNSIDSVIQYNNWTSTNVITIGSQNIQFHEVLWVGENINFNEDIIIDQRGRNYVKTLTFELSGINENLVEALELYTLTTDGVFIPTPSLAILIDENDQYLIVGYDFPLRLETIVDNINNENNNVVITYKSTSISRSRTMDFRTTPSITPTISVTPSVTTTPSLSETSSVTPTSSISVTPTSSISVTPTSSISVTPTSSISVTPTPSITPTRTPTPSSSPTPFSYQVNIWECFEGTPILIGSGNINSLTPLMLYLYYTDVDLYYTHYWISAAIPFNASYPYPNLVGPFYIALCPPPDP